MTQLERCTGSFMARIFQSCKNLKRNRSNSPLLRCGTLCVTIRPAWRPLTPEATGHKLAKDPGPWDPESKRPRRGWSRAPPGGESWTERSREAAGETGQRGRLSFRGGERAGAGRGDADPLQKPLRRLMLRAAPSRPQTRVLPTSVSGGVKRTRSESGGG